jgi:hypothetical protein
LVGRSPYPDRNPRFTIFLPFIGRSPYHVLTETVLFPIFLPFIGRSPYPDRKNLLSTSAYLSVGRPPYPGRKPSCPPLLYTQRWASWYFHLQKEKESTQISTGPIYKEWDE